MVSQVELNASLCPIHCEQSNDDGPSRRRLAESDRHKNARRSSDMLIAVKNRALDVHFGRLERTSGLGDCSQSHCRREGPKQTSAPTVAEHGQADEQQPFFEFLSAGSPTVLAARNTFVARRRQQTFKLLLERV